MARGDRERGIPYFPAFVDLCAKRVIVVGGGAVATTKVRVLLPCQPHPLIVVAPAASPFIRDQVGVHLEWAARAYEPDDLAGATLVFAATDDRALNARVADDARRLGIPVLAVDDVPHCDFIAPALVRRGDLTIAISTGGRSPAMARRAREYLDQVVPASWASLLEVASSAREQLGQARSVIEPSIWQEALDGQVEQLAQAGDVEHAIDVLLKKLERSLFDTRPGCVALVGAGPGDPELLTLRGLRRLQAADVVVYDRLVSSEMLDCAAPTAERMCVGKAPGGVGATQAEVEALLIDLARQGRRVVRLKGGDPFLFGRGGEEALALLRAGVPFEVVPGVSSALAGPAAAGIPVTLRGLAASVTIASGHDPEQHDWAALARGGQTLVFLMAVANLREITDRLMAYGRAVDEPTAVVQWATTARQRTVAGPLESIAELAEGAGVQAPAVFVVGPTAALAAQLSPQRAVSARPAEVVVRG